MIMSSSSNHRVVKSTRRMQTCDLCKARHQKCSGVQPRCNNCELRGVKCSYSRKSSIPDPLSGAYEGSSTASNPSSLPSSISSSEYARLYSQIFGDIVRDLDLSRNSSPQSHAEPSRDTRQVIARLPSFYREAMKLVEEQIQLENKGAATEESGESSYTSHYGDLALEHNLDNIRRILSGSLPHRDVSQRLLDLFFDYQNSVFYICDANEAQAQVALMYQDPKLVSISWYCQMFLMFSVAAQFDDLDDTDGSMYFEIGKKYMDDAIEEDSQNTVWIIRAMLLLCFYQPPTKWTSIWMYLDAAIRGAHKFQLDVGQNQLKLLSDEAYQEWRQVWFTIISFDRWVAIFLGRLPRITESISRDPIFKGSSPTINPRVDRCEMQNHITCLAIISGNILRKMYLQGEFNLNSCRQLKIELSRWQADLPNHLRQSVESGVFSGLPNDQAEATLNLHFMLYGARMLLTRPLLSKALKSRTSANTYSGPIMSVILSDAEACINHASKLINSANSIISSLRQPRRLFLPAFFLANAANIVVLGTVWKRKQSIANDSWAESLGHDQSPELIALDDATRVLDYCGQAIPFVRKYSVLIKNLRQDLNNGAAVMAGSEQVPHLAVAGIQDHSSPLYYPPITRSFEVLSNTEAIDENVRIYNGAEPGGQSSTSDSAWLLFNLGLSQYDLPVMDPLDMEEQSVQSGVLPAVGGFTVCDPGQAPIDSEDPDLLNQIMSSLDGSN